MGRRSRNELQTKREVRRAEAVLATLRELSPDQAARALRDHANATGVSLHAAALAVLSTGPAEPAGTRSVAFSGLDARR